MAQFKTRARALDLLGRQQIAGIPTAINELIKNAHDAYADKFDIDFLEKSISRETVVTIIFSVCDNLTRELFRHEV